MPVRRFKLLAAVLLLASVASAQFRVEPFERQTPDGPIRGLFATVDLKHPDLEVVVGPKADRPDRPTDLAVVLTTTEQFARDERCQLAVNANFFSWHKVKPFGEPIGLVVRDGVVLSPSRRQGEVDDPALLFLRDGRAVVTTGRLPPMKQVRHAVAGVGANETEPGSLLVTDGKNTADTARVAPHVRHPRTAAGVDRTGKVLTLLIVDGRQPDWSIGATLPELAELLIERGVDDAVNLDGGGSTSLLYLNLQTGKVVTNRPSGKTWRAVSTNLGFRVRGKPVVWPSTQPGEQPGTQPSTQAREP
jgi:exopolysaccharide biosynthesis protein